MHHLLTATCLIVLSAAFALSSGAQTPTFEVSIHPQIEADNHIEFGISVDPATVPESRGRSQLSGIRVGYAARARLRHDTDRAAYRLTFDPAIDDYTGEDGFLDQFDAQRFPFTLRASYHLADSLPMFRLHTGTTRRERTSPIYDHWDSFAEVAFGELLAYEFRRRAFDHVEPREDYLLIGSNRHELRSSARVRIDSKTRADVVYRLVFERYDANLSPLLFQAIQVASDFERRDTRNQATASFVRVLASSLLVEAGGDILWNRSNSSFYRFRSGEASLTTFWSVDARRWLRARISKGWIRFDDRDVSERFSSAEIMRRDGQTRILVDAQWAVSSHLTLNVSSDVVQNRTNDEREVFDFLNYTQRIFSAGLSASY